MFSSIPAHVHNIDGSEEQQISSSLLPSAMMSFYRSNIAPNKMTRTESERSTVENYVILFSLIFCGDVGVFIFSLVERYRIFCICSFQFSTTFL